MRAHQAKMAAWLAERARLRKRLVEEEREREAEGRRREESGAVAALARWLWSSSRRGMRFGGELLESTTSIEPKGRRKGRGRAERGAGQRVARLKREQALSAMMAPAPAVTQPPRGIYLHGNVGSGKTMLMDMLFDAAENVVGRARRLHFHSAMLEVHERMHQHWRLRKSQQDASAAADGPPTGGGHGAAEEDEDSGVDGSNGICISVLDALVEDFMGEGAGAALLCFDEMQARIAPLQALSSGPVVDVFTAVVLSGLLERLLERGAVIIMTSNRPPHELNKDGLQRQLFEKFVFKVCTQCHVLKIDTAMDYRRLLLSGSAVQKDSPRRYFFPLNEESSAKVELLWRLECRTLPGREQCVAHAIIPVMFGRTLTVPQTNGIAARFAFEDLCNRAVGVADYIAIARAFQTVFVTDVPILSMKNRDQARRFIALVDELYNHRCMLVCTADASPDELFCGAEEGPLVNFESLQFETEVEGSRLRANVMESGEVASIASSAEGRVAIESQLSGREEDFAFRRAVSRLVEMQSPLYAQAARSSLLPGPEQ
eukprot:SM000220S07069  [mRNA]  locus=s220:179007:183750:- [translate_table: standard]